MTLVELLVSMAVTSIILVGLTGVYFNVTQRYQGWVNRLNTASTGADLAARLQADTHRYVPCGNFDHVTAFSLCPADQAGDTSQAAVRYVVSDSAPYVITRQQGRNGPSVLMVRSVNPSQPKFWAECHDGGSGSTVSGHIHVYNLRIDDGTGGQSVSAENFSVYYVAPWRPGCTP
jgi:Tfp pilus assembly protein PilW